MQIKIIGSKSNYLEKACKILTKQGAKFTIFYSIEEAIEDFRIGNSADLVLIEIEHNIPEFISKINLERIVVPVVACGFENNLKLITSAIKAGAKEYLPLPPDEELIAAILEAVMHEEADFATKSESMSEVIEIARRVAGSDATILITGESGVGKEVMSRFIQKNSKRADEKFVSVNCAAIPENLLESELFGHEKGAFTGAIAKRIGKFEEAHRGTILLDEISEIEPRMQAKLLRVLQEREVDRIGGSSPVKVDVRIIATSNRNLEDEVRAGNFREDLYYRLNVINLEIPPLRQRREDIVELAYKFIEKYSKANDLPVKKLGKEASDAMLEYNWSGNVRELENAIYRAVLLETSSEITLQSLKLNSEKIKLVEVDVIKNVVNNCLGDETKAANILGISLRLLQNKLQEYEKVN